MNANPSNGICVGPIYATSLNNTDVDITRISSPISKEVTLNPLNNSFFIKHLVFGIGIITFIINATLQKGARVVMYEEIVC